MKRFVVIALVMALLFAACDGEGGPGAESKSPETTENKIITGFYQGYLEKNADNVYASIQTSSGGLLVVQNFEPKSGASYPFDGNDLHYLLGYIEAWTEGNELKWNAIPIQWADEMGGDDFDATWIFYEAENAKYDNNSFENMKDYTYYDSRFFFLNGRLGRDLIVIVTPAMKWFLFPYSESLQYGIEPYDTLGTTPMKIIDDSPVASYAGAWHYGYPIWVFAIPENEIDDHYELHFGTYVLTGEDIKTCTWSNGGITSPERPGGRSYFFGWNTGWNTVCK